MKNYLRLLEYLKPYVWPYFVLAMVCMLGYSATEGAMPFLVQWMMDDVFVKKDVAMLYYLPPAIVGIFLIRGLLNFGQGYLSDYVGLRIIQDVPEYTGPTYAIHVLVFFLASPQWDVDFPGRQ